MAQNNKDTKIRKLIRAGQDIAPEAIINASAAAIGFEIAGLSGAIVGGMGLGSVIVQSLSLFATKQLAKREEQKVGLTAIYAKNKIEENLKTKEIRDDDFFEDTQERSAANEIFEATLTAAQRDSEEKKLEYYGNLLGNIPFYPEINRVKANHLIKTAQDLSWNQLCILAVAHKNNLPQLRSDDYRSEPHLLNSDELIFLLSETSTLVRRGLINLSGKALIDMTDINPKKMVVQGVAERLYELMELNKIPNNELKYIVDLFSK